MAGEILTKALNYFTKNRLVRQCLLSELQGGTQKSSKKIWFEPLFDPRGQLARLRKTVAQVPENVLPNNVTTATYAMDGSLLHLNRYNGRGLVNMGFGQNSYRKTYSGFKGEVMAIASKLPSGKVKYLAKNETTKNKLVPVSREEFIATRNDIMERCFTNASAKAEQIH